jgi:hypothetical protein
MGQPVTRPRPELNGAPRISRRIRRIEGAGQFGAWDKMSNAKFTKSDQVERFANCEVVGFEGASGPRPGSLVPGPGAANRAKELTRNTHLSPPDPSTGLGTVCRSRLSSLAGVYRTLIRDPAVVPAFVSRRLPSGL